MPAVASQNQEARLDLFDPLQDALERLTDQDLRLHFDVREFLGHHLGALEVGLGQLQKPLVDDVVVELLLLLELEHLRGLSGEDVLDVAEDGVVILHVERRTHIELDPELPSHL